MVNRASRDACFQKDCSGAYPSSSFPGLTEEGPDVEIKDEKSKVIAKVSSKLAVAIRADLNVIQEGMTQSVFLLGDKRATSRNASILQQKMRKGNQVVDDFCDPGSLFVYARRKFSIRAVITFELLRMARTLLPPEQAILDGNAVVISIGGGPGNDLFGYLLFQKFVVRATTSVASPPLKGLHVFDFAAGWAPIVQQVAELSGHDISFNQSDLTASLASSVNCHVRDLLTRTLPHSDTTLVFLFCYVLSEVMGVNGATPELLEDLLTYTVESRRNALFLCREPHEHALQTLLNDHPNWVESTDYWHVPGGGLMIAVLHSVCRI